MPIFNPSALQQPTELVANALVIGGVPAAIVAVSDGTRTTSSAAGLSDLATDQAAQTNQSFEVGSQTKMAAAVVVLKLAEAGLVDLDVPLSTYLPPAVLDGIANASEVTLRQLLAMRSGIPGFTEVETKDGTEMFAAIAQANPDQVTGNDVALSLVRDLPAEFAPGEAFHYSNTNYVLLALAIEAVTQRDLGSVMDEMVFAPLGMDNSFLDDHRADPLRMSSYSVIDDAFTNVRDAMFDLSAEGGMISTTDDMIQFLRALLVDRSLLSADSLEQMMDFGPAFAAGITFGLGLLKMELADGGTLVGFSGGTYGTESATFLHLQSGRIVSTVVTQEDADFSAVGGLISAVQMLADVADWNQSNDAGPLLVDGVSAADLQIKVQDDGIALIADETIQHLDLHRAQLAQAGIQFADDSQLLTGSHGADRISLSGQTQGFYADNQILGLGGDDTLAGGAGDDRMAGGRGNDLIRGRSGADDLFGGHGNDSLRGGGRADALFGGRGDDFLNGGRGRDRLLGGSGDDRLVGGRGTDRLHGQKGDDQLLGGAGNDRMSGGSGADSFIFGASTRNTQVETDVILDFEAGVDDIDLRGTHVQHSQIRGDDLWLTLSGDGDQIKLVGIDDMSLVDFI